MPKQQREGLCDYTKGGGDELGDDSEAAPMES